MSNNSQSSILHRGDMCFFKLGGLIHEHNERADLVNNFTGNGVVKSFYVPYFCPECDEEKVLLVEATDMGPPPHEPPTCRCDECDLVMDFDDMPDSYFAFLSNQRKLAEPDKINGAMRDLSGERTDSKNKV